MNEILKNHLYHLLDLATTTSSAVLTVIYEVKIFCVVVGVDPVAFSFPVIGR